MTTRKLYRYTKTGQLYIEDSRGPGYFALANEYLADGGYAERLSYFEKLGGELILIGTYSDRDIAVLKSIVIAG
jgi:hypothetical protein